MNTFGVGEARVDLTLRLVRDGSGERRLTATEARLLETLAAAKGRPVPAERLLGACWGEEGNAATLLSVIARLRRKLCPADRPGEPARGQGPLRTVRSEGYVLDMGQAEPPLPGLARSALIGRDVEADQLDQLARPGGFVTVLGPPGVGKTTLARVLVRTRALAGRAVAWCDLAPASTLADVVRVVAVATSAPIEGRLARQDAAALERWLGRFDLVVLDNGEQCLDALAEVAAAWGSATAIVVTSRMPVGLAAERRLELGGLSREAARALFVRVADAISDAEPAPDDLIDRIVDRIDRLPLTIALTAGHVGLLDGPSLLERLDRPLTLLQSNRRDLPDQHRAFRVALARSWRLLPPGVTGALAALSAFPSSFDLSAAEAVLDLPPGEALQAVLAGLDASLLRTPDGAAEARVVMLETVREFADEQLTGAHRADTFTRHARWALGVAETCLTALGGPGERAALDQLSALVPDLFAVARRAPTPELAVRATLAANAVFKVRGPLDGMSAPLEEAVSLARAAIPELLGATLYARGMMLQRIGTGGEPELREALALARTAEDWPLAANCLFGLAALERRAGRLTPGCDTLREMEEAVARAGDPRRAAYLRIERGHAFLDADDLHAARAEISAAADALCALGDARPESSARLLHSIVLHLLGEATAEREILRALALAEATGDARAEIRARNHLGTTALERDDAEAARHFTVALERARAIGATPLVWMVTIQRARALLVPDPAAALADLDTLAGLEHPYEGVPMGYVRARALHGLGRWVEAEATLAALDPTPERDHEVFGYVHAMRAILRLEQRDLAGARAALAVRASDQLGARALALAEARIARAEGVLRDPPPRSPLDRSPDLRWLAG